jgi:hypothetical protein
MSNRYRALNIHIKLAMAILVFLLVFPGIATIIASAAASITVQAPDGDEIWQRGRTKTIEWTSSGPVGSTVDIELYQGGVFFRSIATSTSNDGSFSWGIPTDIPPDIDYDIKITDSTDAGVFDFSDSYFTIGLDKLDFAGYTWRVRDTQGSPSGPGPNIFTSSPENVWLDVQGQLHLRITNRNGIWHCGEIYSEDSFGYGSYTFFTGSRVDIIDKNSILGLFTYLDDTNEIDIEFARWGWEGGTNLDYVCQPGQTSGNAHSFDFALTDVQSTHNFNWQASEIKYRSLYGHHYEPPSPGHVIQTWNYTGADIPPESTERVHMNLWLMDGNPPSDGQELEIVISDFNFTDTSITPTLNPQPTFSTPSSGTTFEPGNAITFDWSDVTPNTGNIHYLIEWTQDPYDTNSQGRYNTGGSWTGDISTYTLDLNAPGDWYYHVYAFDDGGEFGELSDGPGPWDEDYFAIADIPAPPMDLNGILFPPGVLSDVKLTWDASADDGSGDADVVEYVILRSGDITGAYSEIGTVSADGSPSYSFTDSGTGDGDPNNYFYRVHARDDQGKERQANGRAAKWITQLDAGWNQFSIPLVQDATSRTDVLETIDGNYIALQSYVHGGEDNWLHWNGHKPSQLNDELELTNGKSYYIRMSTQDNLVSAGRVSYDLGFDLKEGWNFVGVPAATVPLSRVNLPGSMDLIDHYDVAIGPSDLQRYDPDSQSGDLDMLTPGQGYWIHSGSEATLGHTQKVYEEPEPQNWEDVYLWFDTIVDIAVYEWGIEDPYFAAVIVKQESWFRADCYNQPEKDAYDNGTNPWHGEYYGKGLTQITGPWIAGTPYPDPTDWIYNMPPTAIHGEAPELLDAYNGTQNLNRGFWYIKTLLDYYDNDQYKVATAYRFGWQPLDAGNHDPYNNYYEEDIFRYKNEYLQDLGLSEAHYPNIS